MVAPGALFAVRRPRLDQAGAITPRRNPVRSRDLTPAGPSLGLSGLIGRDKLHASVLPVFRRGAAGCGPVLGQGVLPVWRPAGGAHIEGGIAGCLPELGSASTELPAPPFTWASLHLDTIRSLRPMAMLEPMGPPSSFSVLQPIHQVCVVVPVVEMPDRGWATGVSTGWTAEAVVRFDEGRELAVLASEPAFLVPAIETLAEPALDAPLPAKALMATRLGRTRLVMEHGNRMIAFKWREMPSRVPSAAGFHSPMRLDPRTSDLAGVRPRSTRVPPDKLAARRAAPISRRPPAPASMPAAAGDAALALLRGRPDLARCSQPPLGLLIPAISPSGMKDLARK